MSIKKSYIKNNLDEHNEFYQNQMTNQTGFTNIPQNTRSLGTKMFTLQIIKTNTTIFIKTR